MSMTDGRMEWEPAERALFLRDIVYVRDGKRLTRCGWGTYAAPARALPREPRVNGDEWVPRSGPMSRCPSRWHGRWSCLACGMRHFATASEAKVSAMADAAERAGKTRTWRTLLALARRELRRTRCNPVGKRLSLWPPRARCPAKASGLCDGPYEQCQTFRCPRCRRDWPWCYGMADTPLCNACAAIRDAERVRRRG